MLSFYEDVSSVRQAAYFAYRQAQRLVWIRPHADKQRRPPAQWARPCKIMMKRGALFGGACINGGKL